MGNAFSFVKSFYQSGGDKKGGQKRKCLKYEDSNADDLASPTPKDRRLTSKKVRLDDIRKTGTIIMERYIVQKQMGEGTFGVVLKVKDKRSPKSFALKVIKDRSKSGIADANQEMDMLRKIKEMDTKNCSRIISLRDTFTAGGYCCMVFDLMEMSLQDYIESSDEATSIETVQKVGYQVLQALHFLKMAQVIHADLKPDNIMIKNLNTFEIKVIDLGSYIKMSGRLQSYFQTRYYRAPETILDATYDYGIDIWSLGCVLFELRTKTVLFGGADEFDQLQKIMEALGPVPDKLICDGALKFKKFSDNTNGESFRLRNRSKMYFTSRCQMLFSRLTFGDEVEFGTWDTCQGSIKSFVQLLNEMLHYDIRQRISAENAMTHCFFEAIQISLKTGKVSTRSIRE